MQMKCGINLIKTIHIPIQSAACAPELSHHKKNIYNDKVFYRICTISGNTSHVCFEYRFLHHFQILKVVAEGSGFSCVDVLWGNRKKSPGFDLREHMQHSGWVYELFLSSLSRISFALFIDFQEPNNTAHPCQCGKLQWHSIVERHFHGNSFLPAASAAAGLHLAFKVTVTVVTEGKTVVLAH